MTMDDDHGLGPFGTPTNIDVLGKHQRAILIPRAMTMAEHKAHDSIQTPF